MKEQIKYNVKVFSNTENISKEEVIKYFNKKLAKVIFAIEKKCQE